MANAYISILEDLHHTDVCPITFDDMTESAKYMRGIIQIRNEDSEGNVKPPSEYNPESLFTAIQFKKEDPLTRRMFSEEELDRIRFYNEAYKMRMKKTEFSPSYIYSRFKTLKSSPSHFSISEYESIIKQVRYFLLVEDFVDMFKSFSGDGSLLNRQAAFSYLEDKPIGTWLVRKSSAIDDTYDKFYAITYKDSVRYKNVLILHKIGKGIYICDSAARGSTRFDVSLGKGFPCFYDLISYLGLDWDKSI